MGTAVIFDGIKYFLLKDIFFIYGIISDLFILFVTYALFNSKGKKRRKVLVAIIYIPVFLAYLIFLYLRLGFFVAF